MSQAISDADGIHQILDGTINAVETFQKLFLGDEHPYKKLDDALAVLENHCDDLSYQTVACIGEIRALTLSAKSNYYSSTKKIDAWCGKASELLNVYINLCSESFFSRINFFRSDRYDAEAVKTQRDTLEKVLSDGIVEMSEALRAYENSVESFDQAAGKLTVLQKALGEDKCDVWITFKAVVGGVKDSVCLAVGAIFFIRSGMALALIGIASVGTNIVGRVISLNQNFKELAKNVANSKAEINHMKAMCVEEMDIIVDLKAQADTANFYLTKRLLQSQAIGAIRKLIILCDEYREKHRNKNLQKF